MKHVPAEHLFPCTNCGMAPMAADLAWKKVEALAKGAAIVRKELGAR
jgi:5-methyltetrahydropteroyltriglutamate--homocysteine methyltransferase